MNPLSQLQETLRELDGSCRVIRRSTLTLKMLETMIPMIKNTTVHEALQDSMRPYGTTTPYFSQEKR